MIYGCAWIAAVAGPVWAYFTISGLARRGRFSFAWTFGVIFTIAWALGVWAFLVEPETLVVRRVAVDSGQWRGPPLRLGVISDTHVGAPHGRVSRVRSIVERMNAEHPDIVVLLGDYAGGHEADLVRAHADRSQILQGVAAFAQLKAPLGVYSVIGNHDVWYDQEAIEDALTKAHVEVLYNRGLPVNRPDAGDFWLGGLAEMDRGTPSIAEALGGAPPQAPVILLSHYPDPFAQVPASVALTLAAHSHCGQVNLPLLGRPILPGAGSRRWPCGLYDEGGRKLFVSGGIGTSILPVRFRAPPEIDVITLRGKGLAPTPPVH
jgi:predicted MPP superfamily phosphohydrolase